MMITKITNYDMGFKAGIKEYEKRLLNKMFPYDVCDKKEYSINAYAVYKAITDVATETINRVLINEE